MFPFVVHIIGGSPSVVDGVVLHHPSPVHDRAHETVLVLITIAVNQKGKTKMKRNEVTEEKKTRVINESGTTVLTRSEAY